MKILEQFCLEGEIANIYPYGEGHINSTYKVDMKDGKSYVLQKINTSIFKDYVGVINNILLVTDYLRGIIRRNGGEVDRETMTLLPTIDGKYYYVDENGDCYRVYLFIEGSKCYQTATSKELLASSGKAFGKFMADLDGFDATKLADILPHFHETPVRYENFEKAVKADVKGRLSRVENEVGFYRARKDFYYTITDLLSQKKIPTRVTHNDTKLNNILFDEKTDEALCVIDLDTIMAGSLLYDFGDSVRFGCSTAKEDEVDKDKIHFDMSLYESYLKGYLEGAGDKITKEEVDNLHNGAIMMTLECGMRFLTDYLEGDTYFKTAYPEHNLVRATSQMLLAKEMEERSAEMKALAYKYYRG